MNTQGTKEYQAAWNAYEAAGHDVTKLGAVHVAALRDDDVTRRNLDAPGPVERTSRPAAPTAAAGPPPMPDAEEMGRALFASIEAYLASGLNDLDSTQSDLGDLCRKYAGTGATPRAFGIRYRLTRDALDLALRFIGHLNTQVKELRAEVKALEAAPSKSIEYTGVWDQQKIYAIGNACTFAGSLWIARTASVSRRPGSGDGAWQLAAKRGADAKNCACKCAAGDKGPQ